MSNQIAQLNNKPPLQVEVKHIGTSPSNKNPRDTWNS